MHVTKKRHVWRTEQITSCDVYRGKQKLATEEYSGNVGVGRVFNMAFEKYGDGITISNINKRHVVYVMDMEEFKAKAQQFDKAETNLK